MEQRRRPGLLEAIGVWSLFALVVLAILVTYSRLPPESLYHTSGDGLDAGASRALVFAGFPVALVAIPLAWIAVARIRTRLESKLPSVIRPDLSPAWLGVLLGALAIYFALFGVGRVNRPEGVIR
jgi:uncharacterized membrane protein YozB (DUF420 family)